MSICYAMLLDGGFVKHKLGAIKGHRGPVDAVDITKFVAQISTLPILNGMRLHRIYFYDAKPLQTSETKPFGGGHIDFGAKPTASRNKSLHATLSKEPFFALRFGDLSLEGWRLKRRLFKKEAPVAIDADALEPNIRQKGVDMRIGLDIASLTLKKHVHVIVLVTGDSDFVPAMKFARREGAQLILLTLGHGVRDGLKEHADMVIDTFPLPDSGVQAGHQADSISST